MASSVADCRVLLETLVPHFRLFHLIHQYLELDQTSILDPEELQCNPRRWFDRDERQTGARAAEERTRCGTTVDLLEEILLPPASPRRTGEQNEVVMLDMNTQADLERTLGLLQQQNVLQVGLDATTLLRPDELTYLRRRNATPRAEAGTGDDDEDDEDLELDVEFTEEDEIQTWGDRDLVAVPGFDDFKADDARTFPGHAFYVVRTGPDSYDIVESYLGLYEVQWRRGLRLADVRRLLYAYWSITLGRRMTADDAQTWARITHGGDIRPQVGMVKRYSIKLLNMHRSPTLHNDILMRIQYRKDPLHCGTENALAYVRRALALLDMDPRRDQQFRDAMGMTKQEFRQQLLHLVTLLEQGLPRRSKRLGLAQASGASSSVLMEQEDDW